MDMKIKAKRRSRRMKESRKFVDQDVAGPIILRISSDTDIELGIRS
ncbi:hypothetical protein OESDEN_11273 [Oesophagostomum dentatum]|nr:hypothetical protein OESDEN_11273 [Oesophagostomum dentatum]